MMLVGLPPHGFGLGLDACHSTENGYGTIQYAQAPLDFCGEVNVPGRVNDIDTASPPLTSSSSGCDGDTALPFLRHVIHGGGTVMDFAHAVHSAGVEQDTFGNGGLAGIDVGHNSDISDFVKGI